MRSVSSVPDPKCFQVLVVPITIKRRIFKPETKGLNVAQNRCICQGLRGLMSIERSIRLYGRFGGFCQCVSCVMHSSNKRKAVLSNLTWTDLCFMAIQWRNHVQSQIMHAPPLRPDICTKF